jgi:hypothetical protein
LAEQRREASKSVNSGTSQALPQTEKLEKNQPTPLYFDPLVLHSSIVNSKKQLLTAEHDYVSTLKKLKKLQQNPHVENKLSGNIWYLDQLITKEKQIQMEQIQSQKQIDRLQTKAIML